MRLVEGHFSCLEYSYLSHSASEDRAVVFVDYGPGISRATQLRLG